MSNSKIKFLKSCLLLVLLTGIAAPLKAQQATIELTQSMVDSTTAFLSGLTSQQREIATYPFNDEERLNWHFIPRSRNGITFNDMNTAQRESASNLLQAFLSAKGYSTVEQIRSLESVLREIEVNGRFDRDPEDYYFTVFGTPSISDTWAFRFEGHHIALNWTFVEGNGIASSPQFFGTNPAEVRQGDKSGLRVLAAEEDYARELVKSLSNQQQTAAILNVETPRDIYTGAEVEVSPLDNSGIAYSSLNSMQQILLMRVIGELAGAQPDAIADQRMEQVRDNANVIKFAWIGGTERGDAHYYRIQGAGFLIEYDNTQNNANHIHLVWRDFDGDFGNDLIRMHYSSVAAEFGPGHNH